MTVFKKTLPMMVPTFVNRCGSVGMSFLPMLLVVREFNTTQSTFVMTSVKMLLFIAPILGGFLADRFGYRRTILFNFLCSGTALAFLPFQTTALAIACFAGVLQLTNQNHGPFRIFLKEHVGIRDQQEAIGWTRTSNNLGQLVAYSVSWIFAGFGLVPLLLFDSMTSFLAWTFGYKFFPKTPAKLHPEDFTPHLESLKGRKRSLFKLTLVGLFFFFLFELFMASLSAKCRLLFGREGIAIFSKVMVINTILCTLFAVRASRLFHSPNKILPLGVICMALGNVLALHRVPSLVEIYLAAFFTTAGEILFTSVYSHTLMKAIAGIKKEGQLYGTLVTFQAIGTLIGGAAAFPLVIDATDPELFVWSISIALTALSVFLIRTAGLERGFSVQTTA